MRRLVIASVLLGTLSLSALSQSASVRTEGPMAPSPVRRADQPMTSATTARTPDFVLPERYRDRAGYPLPARFNLAAASPYYTPYDPTIPGLWKEQGMSCANASAVNVLFSHEANRERGFRPDPRSPSPEYTYEFTYHFLNNADMMDGDFWMSFAVMDILKEVGCATTADFGGLEWGNAFGGWMSGYDKYYRAMKVRLDEYYDLDASAPGSEEAIKQVLLDHGDGSQLGAAVQTHVSFSARIDKRKMAGPDGPQTSVYYDYGAGGGHSISIVGWDDTYLADLGGAWIMQDAYPVGLSYSPRARWKTGTTLNFPGVGVPVLFQRIRKGYSPKVAFKVQITHNQRGNIAVMTGVGPASGTAPAAWKDYAGAFNYAGGLHPMVGRGQSGTLEFGLDMTDFAGLLTSPGQKLYLMVYSKGGTGTIDKLSIMDYTGAAPKEIAAAEAPKPIAPGAPGAPALTTLAVTWPGSVSVREPAAGAGNMPPIAWRKAGSVRVRLTDAAASRAALSIRNSRGRLVFSDRVSLGAPSGPFVDLPWSMKDSRGVRVPPGLYFASVELSKGKEVLRAGTARIDLAE